MFGRKTDQEDVRLAVNDDSERRLLTVKPAITSVGCVSSELHFNLPVRVPYNADNYALLQSLAPPHKYQGFL